MGSYKEDIEYAYKVLEFRDNIILNKYSNVKDKDYTAGPVYMEESNLIIGLFTEVSSSFNRKNEYFTESNIITFNNDYNGILVRYANDSTEIIEGNLFLTITDEETHFLNSLEYNSTENLVITIFSVLNNNKYFDFNYTLDLKYMDKCVV